MTDATNAATVDISRATVVAMGAANAGEYNRFDFDCMKNRNAVTAYSKQQSAK